MPFLQNQARFVAANDTAALTMVSGGGPRINSKQTSQYGLYSARLLVDGNRGVVTAFYVGPRRSLHG